MASELPSEIVAELAARLEGTCGDVISELESLGFDSCAHDACEVESALAEHVGRCEGCGWWCEICELDPDTECCEDCKED